MGSFRRPSFTRRKLNLYQLNITDMSIAKPQIIDVHSHVLPPEYVSTLDQRGIKPVGGVSWPKWSPELALEMMDNNGIEKTILSLSEPSVFFWR